jgi:hypothetical protein
LLIYTMSCILLVSSMSEHDNAYYTFVCNAIETFILKESGPYYITEDYS